MSRKSQRQRLIKFYKTFAIGKKEAEGMADAVIEIAKAFKQTNASGIRVSFRKDCKYKLTK